MMCPCPEVPPPESTPVPATKRPSRPSIPDDSWSEADVEEPVRLTPPPESPPGLPSDHVWFSAVDFEALPALRF